MNIWLKKSQLNFEVGDWVYWDQSKYPKDIYDTIRKTHPRALRIIDIKLAKTDWVAVINPIGSTVNLEFQKKVSKDFVPQ
jgi:hypothetical protein